MGLVDQVSSTEGHLVAATLPTEATPAAQAAELDQPHPCFYIEDNFEVFSRGTRLVTQ